MMGQHLTELECPHCNTKVKITLFSSLNISITPSAKEDLLRGDINRFQCPHCEHKAYVAIPFIYHDMHNQFCVQYFPFEYLNEKDFFDNFMPDGKLFMNLSGQNMEYMQYMEDIHVVFSMHELIQYVIFRDRLCEAKRGSISDN